MTVGLVWLQQHTHTDTHTVWVNRTLQGEQAWPSVAGHGVSGLTRLCHNRHGSSEIISHGCVCAPSGLSYFSSKTSKLAGSQAGTASQYIYFRNQRLESRTEEVLWRPHHTKLKDVLGTVAEPACSY